MVTGTNRDSVVHSKQAIDRLITSLLADSPYTHFLSFPLPSFHSSLETFRSTVLATSPTATTGIEPSIFVRPTSLHFTIAMLTLPTSHHVQRAAAALSSLTVSASTPLTIRLRGLAVMNDKPEAAHVLYIQPDEPSQQRLTELAGRLIAGMRQAGVLSESDVRKQRLMLRDRTTGEERANVKWHATIINTKHRARGARTETSVATQAESGGEASSGKRAYVFNKRQSVDAREILAQHGGVDWGEGVISGCELSALSWDNRTNYYPCEAKLPL